MTKPDGGPAFPVEREEASPFGGGQSVLATYSGISIRDYFAAHAPVLPQPWFSPVLPPAPQAPEYPPNLHPDTDRVLRQWKQDPHYDLVNGDGAVTVRAIAPRDTDVVVSYVHALLAHWNRLEEWQRHQKVARFIQWPYAYADAMLAERAK